MGNHLKNHFGGSNIVLVAFLFICLFSLNEVSAQNESSRKELNTYTSGEFSFSGHLGNYFDKISEQRIINQDNWNESESRIVEIGLSRVLIRKIIFRNLILKQFLYVCSQSI